MEERSKIAKIDAELYLERESLGTVKHEFVDGQVFAMSGSTPEHNLISGNLFVVIHAKLKGSKCRVFINDVKLRILRKNSFYYPDLVVTCEQQIPHSSWIEQPLLLVEVLSRSTRQTDKREKLAAYTSVESLREYVLIEQYRMHVTVIRRLTDNEWETLAYARNDRFSLQSIGLENILVNDLYEGIDVVPSVEEEEVDYMTMTSDHAPVWITLED